MKRTILLHKPHKGILKPYQLDEIKSELMKAGFLKEENEHGKRYVKL